MSVLAIFCKRSHTLTISLSQKWDLSRICGDVSKSKEELIPTSPRYNKETFWREPAISANTTTLPETAHSDELSSHPSPLPAHLAGAEPHPTFLYHLPQKCPKQWQPRYHGRPPVSSSRSQGAPSAVACDVPSRWLGTASPPRRGRAAAIFGAAIPRRLNRPGTPSPRRPPRLPSRGRPPRSRARD